MANKIEVKADLDPSGFKRGIEQVNSGLDKARGNALKFKNILVSALSLGAAAGTANEAEQIIRASEATGISPETIQAVGRTMRLPDVSNTVDILKEIQTKQAEALQLGSGTVVEGFALLGIGPLDLEKKRPEELLKMMIAGGSKLPIASQRLAVDEIALGSDDDRGQMVSMMNDPTFLERLEQNKAKAIPAEDLILASDTSRKGKGIWQTLKTESVKAVGSFFRDSDILITKLVDGEEAATRKLERQREELSARMKILDSAEAPANEVFTNEAAFRKFIDGQLNEEIKRLMERQLEEMIKLNQKNGITSEFN